MRKITMIVLVFIYLLSPLYSLNPAYAKQPNAVSNLMVGIASPACIKTVKKIEDTLFRNLPIRTHTIVDEKSPKNNTFSSLSVVNYQGDDSHITITATPVESGCSAVYMETFIYPESCVVAREQLFSKWLFMGKMIGSMVFNYKRDKKLLGYLTPQDSHRKCLVQKRKIFFDKK